ncbi:MAG: hypothetical protein ACXQTL_06300 [Methanosarcinales archaeon]
MVRVNQREVYRVFRVGILADKLVGEYSSRKEAMAKKREICQSLGYKTARCEAAYIVEVMLDARR